MSARPITVMHDTEGDTITICGIRYAAELFRSMAIAQPGSWYRIEERRDGTISVFKPDEHTERTLDIVSGRHVKQRLK